MSQVFGITRETTPHHVICCRRVHEVVSMVGLGSTLLDLESTRSASHPGLSPSS